MIALVFTFRKEYDALKHIGYNKSKKAKELHAEYERIQEEQGNEQSHHILSGEKLEQYQERLASLKMQLNTVTIKIAETGENRRNYELNIAHLKEEDFEHFNQLKALRKQNTDINLFVKKMTELQLAAMEEKEKGEQELLQFRSEIDNYQTFVHEQLQQFQHILDIVRKQNEKREKAKLIRKEKQTAALATRIQYLNSEATAAEKEAAGLASRLTSLDLKVTSKNSNKTNKQSL